MGEWVRLGFCVFKGYGVCVEGFVEGGGLDLLVCVFFFVDEIWGW